MILDIEIAGTTHRVNVVQRETKFLITIGDAPGEPIDAVFPEPGIIQFIHGSTSYEFRAETVRGSKALLLDRRGKNIAVMVRDPRALRSRRGTSDAEAGPMKITAPMPGKVVRILAAAGTAVALGAGVIVIEAMKMQNELKSPKTGTVQKITVEEGATVNPGDTLAIIE